MKWPFPFLICALLSASVAVSRGDDQAEKRPARTDGEKRKDEWNKLPPEEREARMKEWRKTNGLPSRSESEKRREQTKKMSPEERAAKRKEIMGRLEKRIAELRDRKVNGTLTASEARDLKWREQILKRFEQEAKPRMERPKPLLTNAPKACCN